MRSKIDSLLFMPDSVKGAKTEDFITNRDLPVAQTDAQKTIEHVAEKEIEIAVENVERPVDLYKVLFAQLTSVCELTCILFNIDDYIWFQF